MSDPATDLKLAVSKAATALRGGEQGSEPMLERPPKAEFGDYSTNAAMLLAPNLGKQPREVAEELAEQLKTELGDRLERVEIAGPGFLNLFLSDAWYRDAIVSAIEAGDERGSGVAAEPERILVEFVSANPTGPLTAAGGRHAAYGDSISRILERAGHSIEREYYINDVGTQVGNFAKSIAARMRGEDPPEDGYEGDYVTEVGEKLAAKDIAADDLDQLELLGIEQMVDSIRTTLSRFGVEFDTWFSERSIHDAGLIETTLEDLRKTEHLYETEGATWLRTSEFGDDKDRVLIRSGGESTYYLSDIAYHHGKMERGFDRLIDVLGADHHGYIGRLKAGLAAFGHDPDSLEVLIMQLVHVIEAGERAQMSKRKGEFVTLDELIDDIGADAARFFMLQRSHDTTVDLDLELARTQSNENPVYYVQYAHARIASILRKAEEEAPESLAASESVEAGAFNAPFEPAERALLKRLLELPGEVREAAAKRAPHRLCAYGTATAADYHAFYRDCKVIGAEGDGVEAARLALCRLAKRTIADTLGMLGISTPERM